MIISGAIVGLCAWSLAAGSDAASERLFVPVIPGILAAMALIVAVASYFAAPYHKLTVSCWLNYALCCVMAVALVMTTGGVRSPFMSLRRLPAYLVSK